MSYRDWRREYRRRTGSNYENGYPWSGLYLAVPVGIVGLVTFRNVFAGAGGFAACVVLGLWYWKPGGRGRRSKDS